MKIKEIISEIQYKSPTTFLDRQNPSEYDISSVGDPYEWHRNGHNNKKTKPKRPKKINQNR
jgi:hypothetical protein